MGNLFFSNMLLTNASTAAGNDGSILSTLVDFTVAIMEALGGIGIALLIALENIFPPIPSEIILPLAGFTASQGNSFSLFSAILWATLGSVVGALALYGIARLFGRNRTRWFLSKLPLMEEKDIDKTEIFFEKHERSAVFFGRLLPIFRSLISLPAGVIKMQLPKFIAFTAIGSMFWNTALITAGYLLGENWDQVEVYIGFLSKVVLATILLALLAWIIYKIYQNKEQNKEKERGTNVK